jgi:hypothetical protein
MRPPTLTDLTVEELLKRAEIELRDIEKIVADRSVAPKQRDIQRYLFDVLKTLEQVRFSASYGLTVVEAAKLCATSPQHPRAP